MLKKLTILMTALVVSAPAFADRGDHHSRGHGYGHAKRIVVHERYVVQRPVYVQPVYVQHYRPAPRPVYVVRHAPPPPAVVYHQSHSNAGAALLVGAILGGAIVHSVVTGGY